MNDYINPEITLGILSELIVNFAAKFISLQLDFLQEGTHHNPSLCELHLLCYKGTETFANYDSTCVNISPIKSEFEISGLISNLMVFFLSYLRSHLAMRQLDSVRCC